MSESKIKRAGSIAAALTMLPLGMFLSSQTALAADNLSEDTVILYTNDVHCGIDTAIGYDGLKLYKREMEATHENVLLVDAGDAIQGGPIGTLSEGADIIEFMNAVGYDAAIPGNHEFDYTIPTLLKRSQELECNYLCCNFFDTRTNESVFMPYELFDTGDSKVAFVGITTPETFLSSTPTYFQDENRNFIYSFSESGDALYEVTQKSIDSARNDGADYVILVGHLGETDNGTNWLAMDVVEHTNGADALIDGHSHQETPMLMTKNKDGKEIPVSQTGTKLNNIGKMTISSDGSISTELIDTVPKPSEDMDISSDSYIERADGTYGDKEINEMIAEKNKELNDILGEVIGTVSFELYDSDPSTGIRKVRYGETNLGDFISDAIKNYAGAEIGLFNGGGIRSNIPAGDITYNDICTVLPYRNKFAASMLTGQQILDILEVGSMVYPSENGSFIQPSGLEYTIDESIPSSVKLDDHLCFIAVDGEYRVKDVKVNGEPLDLDRIYSVASCSYMLIDGGDSSVVSGKVTPYKNFEAADADIITEYIKNYLNGVIPESYKDPSGSGRIKIINSKTDKKEESQNESTQNSASQPVKSPNTGRNTPIAASCALVLMFGVSAAAARKKIK